MDGRIGHSEEVGIEAAMQFALGYGSRAVATYLGLPHGTARTWQDAYRQGHLLNSSAVRENKSYPAQLKQAAVEKFLAGTPKAEIILEFGISTRSLFDRWVAAYRKDGPSGLVPRSKGRRPSAVGKESLEQKVYRLEMENALLKKFQALMAKGRSVWLRRTFWSVISLHPPTPNSKWATDVTEFHVLGLKQHLSPVIDLFNGELISYELGPTPGLGLVTTMLDKALARLDEATKPMIHYDLGWHYRHITYRNTLESSGLQQSMSRKEIVWTTPLPRTSLATLRKSFSGRELLRT